MHWDTFLRDFAVIAVCLGLVVMAALGLLLWWGRRDDEESSK